MPSKHCSTCKLAVALQKGCINCIECCDVLDCSVHGESLRDSILSRKTKIHKEAAKLRARRIMKGRFREPNFKYQGDSVVIWDSREFFRNKAWKQETKSIFARKLKHQQANGNPLSLKGSRKRFHKIMDQLNRQIDG